MLDDLREQPEQYTLFSALRLIEQAHPDPPRLGVSRKAADDPVHIVQRPHLHFAPAEVAAFQAGDTAVPRLEEHNFGIFGPNGALPLHLTELAYSRELQTDDPTFGAFINAFQHRFASLFYRAWADSNPCTSFDWTDADLFRLYAGALIGIAPRAARDRDCVLDYAKLARAGLFAPQSRSAESLERIIADYFELDVELLPFIGEWLDIAEAERCRLGGPRESATLGSGTTWREHVAVPVFFRHRAGALGDCRIREFPSGCARVESAQGAGEAVHERRVVLARAASLAAR